VVGKKFASAWAYPAGTGYVATATITAPTALASSSVTTKQATLTWTVGDAGKPLILRIVGNATSGGADAATPVDYVTLPAGTTRYILTGLDSGGPWWHTDIAHRDDYGGLSSRNNLAAFQATGTAATAPTPGGIVITRDLTSSPYPQTPTGLIPFGGTGIEMQLVSAPTGQGLDLKLYRAPDSSGAPGTYALLTTIPGSAVPGRAVSYRDALPVDNTPYWYKCSHIGNGVSEGSYTPDVTAKAGWLPPMLVTSEQGQPVLGQVETVSFPATLFIPDSNVNYTLAGRKIIPGVVGVGTALVAYCMVGQSLRPGTQIMAVRFRVHCQGASDTFVGDLSYGVDDTTTSVSSGTAVSVSGGGTQWATLTAGIPHTMVAGRSYFLSAIIHANATADDSRLYYCELDVVRDSYRLQ
jgi:hypothetical protein